ncbi:hypothetical protein CEXT_481421 [Caerostris extrusa]|uniref:Uncharacterized protein n=1 Tax=Caerostris extrusa TaxID=172846 RepID=A0AAV4WCG6_CAEEX|nr:hypothetical protein CEXT_481421 [Caerostris extrusa]
MTQCTYFPTSAISSTPVYCRIIYRTPFSYKSRSTPEIFPDREGMCMNTSGTYLSIRKRWNELEQCSFLFERRPNENPAIYRLLCQDASRVGHVTHFDSYKEEWWKSLWRNSRPKINKR